MTWQGTVETTVTGLGYDLVGCDRSAAGLLRVYIDKMADASAAGEFIHVDDCERVTRQLQYVLEVEAVPYERLEVSSPGLDRPLNKPADYERFAGSVIQVTLRLAFQGRKKYTGVLSLEGDSYRLVFNDGKTDQAFDFSFDEVREARLVPAINFKGRKVGDVANAAPAAKKPKVAKRSNAKARQVAEPDDKDDKIDGGLDQ